MGKQNTKLKLSPSGVYFTKNFMKLIKDIIYFIVGFAPLLIFCYMIGKHISN